MISEGRGNKGPSSNLQISRASVQVEVRLLAWRAYCYRHNVLGVVIETRKCLCPAFLRALFDFYPIVRQNEA